MQGFLELTTAEAALIEMKLALAREVKAARKARKMSQKALAALINSSQPRVATMEKGEATIDQLTKALVTLGVGRDRLGELRAGS